MLPFHNGTFNKDGDTFLIGRLVVIINADVISAQNTDIAEIIAKDFMAHMDEKLGYKYGKLATISYLSNVIVEFDNVNSNALLRRLSDIIAAAVMREQNVVSLKRLAFGEGDPQTQSGIISLETIDRVDFIIERRVGAPYSANRFFCSAPLSTSAHIEALAKIDEALAS